MSSGLRKETLAEALLRVAESVRMRRLGLAGGKGGAGGEQQKARMAAL